MTQALRFTLSGRTAMFKQPEVNAYRYYTYGNIHKIALQGILGAILGLSGYADQRENPFPAFYTELKDIKVSIVPKNDKGMFNKSFISFNNSVGYASKEQGGNLIVQEQWLIDPAWDIYLLLENRSAVEEEIVSRILESRFVYTPYLGKNDHPASIIHASIVELEEAGEVETIDSLFLKTEDLKFTFYEKNTFKYEEKLPVTLTEATNHYQTASLIHTDFLVESSGTFYKDKDTERVISFI